MKLSIVRDDFHPERTFGKFFVDGKYLGEILEDTDRHLEDGGDKDYGNTAIPRGLYKVTVTFSNRFKRPMPYVHDVPGFSGVRIHGGNTEADTLGCPLLGNIRTATGIKNCQGANERLMNLLEVAEDNGEEVWLEVK